MLNAITRLPDLNDDQTKSIVNLVVGDTLQEAEGLVQNVMDIAARIGERKINACIFDQMMEYGTNMVLGTEITGLTVDRPIYIFAGYS